MYRRWKQGLATRKEYRSTSGTHRDGVWKTKAPLNSNLARDRKGNKKSF